MCVSEQKLELFNLFYNKCFKYVYYLTHVLTGSEVLLYRITDFIHIFNFNNVHINKFTSTCLDITLVRNSLKTWFWLLFSYLCVRISKRYYNTQL